ncbi:hypothetical protein ACFV2N_46150 [Streptomyces sp. NPDC059680]|uniref:hypothetical protein n=1 Tax=Streptomyces sp. NPDC059680 TaxID=3346904 RepID=UPI0036A7D2DB
MEEYADPWRNGSTFSCQLHPLRRLRDLELLKLRWHALKVQRHRTVRDVLGSRAGSG